MASRYKDRQPAPGCKPEVERLAQAQARDRRYAAPGVRVKAQDTRMEPRRAWQSQSRVSQPFRRAKAAPNLGVVAQAELDVLILGTVAKVEADIRAEAAARVAEVRFVPFVQVRGLRDRLIAQGLVTPA